MNLLIAEDNSKMRNMIKEMFKPYFEKIYECENGLAAVTEYKTNKPDWVFMDIKMNVMNGLMATEEITKDFPDAKIIIVTGFNDTEFRKAAESSGAIAYVLKENLNDIFKVIGI